MDREGESEKMRERGREGVGEKADAIGAEDLLVPICWALGLFTGCISTDEVRAIPHVWDLCSYVCF